MNPRERGRNSDNNDTKTRVSVFWLYYQGEMLLKECARTFGVTKWPINIFTETWKVFLICVALPRYKTDPEGLTMTLAHHALTKKGRQVTLKMGVLTGNQQAVDNGQSIKNARVGERGERGPLWLTTQEPEFFH